MMSATFVNGCCESKRDLRGREKTTDWGRVGGDLRDRRSDDGEVQCGELGRELHDRFEAWLVVLAGLLN